MVRKKYDQPLSVRFRPAEKEAIERLMEATGDCRNTVIRDAIRFAASQLPQIQNEKPRSAA